MPRYIGDTNEYLSSLLLKVRETNCPVLNEEYRSLKADYRNGNRDRFYGDDPRALQYIPTLKQLGTLNIRMYTEHTPHSENARNYCKLYRIPFTEIKIQQPSNVVKFNNISATMKPAYQYANEDVLKTQTNQNVYPFVFIGDRFIGGHHLLNAYMHNLSIRVYTSSNNSEFYSTVRVLDRYNLPYRVVDLDMYDRYHDKLIKKTGKMNGPYIFIGFDYLWNGLQDLNIFLRKYKNTRLTQKLWKQMRQYFLDKTSLEF